MARYQLIAGDLFCEGDGAKARGQLEGNKVLVVFAGSTATGSRVEGANQRLVSQGVWIHHGAGFRFVQDFPFESPAAAAGYILGSVQHAWKAWRNAAGRTLRELVKQTGWEELTGK